MVSVYVVGCLVLLQQVFITNGKLGKHAADSAVLWSHGCRGIPGLEQSVNTLRCPPGCSITISQVTYATKTAPGCPYEISQPVEPRCCRREPGEDCFQDKAQKIPMLQLLCREAANVCELSVDRVVIRCPRNAFSISTLRSIRYGCECENPSSKTSFGPAITPTETTTQGRVTSTTSFSPSITTPSTSANFPVSPTPKKLPLPAPLPPAPAPIIPIHSDISVGPLVTSTTTSFTFGKPVSSKMTSVSAQSDKTATSTTTTPWTITAKNKSKTEVGDRQSEDQGAHQSSGKSSTPDTDKDGAALLGGIVGAACLILVVSAVATLLLCIKRRRQKSDTQGTEEVSQYSYEIMDISLRRPAPINLGPPEITSLGSSEDANDINLENQTEQGSFLEKQIQRYLITSIYAEIKDVKRLSQESNGVGKTLAAKNADDVVNEVAPVKLTATVKPTPKPRKISDLYAKVKKKKNFQPGPEFTLDDSATRTDQAEKEDTECVYQLESNGSIPEAARVSPPNSDHRDYLHNAPTILTEGGIVGGRACATARCQQDTYDRLLQRDRKDGPTCREEERVPSGPYDQLYSSKAPPDTVCSQRYFDNLEYSTVNVQGSEVSLLCKECKPCEDEVDYNFSNNP